MLKFLLILALALNFSLAQEQIGAVPSAMSSYVSVCNDIWSIFYNPAGLAKFGERKISISYIPAKFGLNELSEKAIAFFEPSLPIKIGLAIKIFGYELYKETVLKLSLSKDFENFVIGANLNYTFISIKNYGSAGTPSADLGFIAQPVKFLKTGVFIKNIISGKIGKARENLPKSIELGLSFLPTQSLITSFSIFKETEIRESIKYGAEYKPTEWFALRFGVQNFPAQFSGGFGFKYSPLEIDYSASKNLLLGLTHQITISATIGKSK